MMLENLVIKFYTLNRWGIILFLLLYIILFSICSLKWKEKLWWKMMVAGFGVVFLVFIFVIAVFRREVGMIQDIVNLVPFHSYYRYFSGQNTEALRTNLMNMILFAPLGIFAAELFPKRFPLWKKILFIVIPCCMLSISIESLQYIRQCGEVEMDDVINNTFGAFIGTICVPVMTKIFTILKNSLSSLKGRTYE